jgi:hypothetical protein
MKSKFLLESLSKLGLNTEGLDNNSLVERKGYNSDIEIMPEEERTIKATISTNDIDADGDIVIPEGANISRYVNNPVVHWNHNYALPPIGKCTELKICDNKIEAKIQFADTQHALDIWNLVKGGFLKAHSIGFVTIKALVNGTNEFKKYCQDKGITTANNCKRIITDFLLIEDSIVSIPSNPMALTQAISSKSINISNKTIKDLGISEAPVTPAEAPEAPEAPKESLEAPKAPEVPPPTTEAIVEPYKPKYTVVRRGDYVATEEDRKALVEQYKSFKCGKII